MRSPALGIAWELYRPHRWWLGGLAGYLFVVFLLYHLVGVETLAQGLGNAFLAEALAQQTLSMEDLVRTIGFVSALPVVIGLIGMLVEFDYGLQTNLRMKDSSFPRRMFVLPLRTMALVGWPMLYGTTAVALTWVAMAEGLLRPCGIQSPSKLLPLLAAAVLASYDWKFTFPFMNFLSNLPDKKSRRLYGIAIFRNEPYS